MGALAPLVRVALDQPESGPLGPRPGDFHSPLVELCRCVKTNPFWVSYRFLTGFLKPTAPSMAPSSPGSRITGRSSEPRWLPGLRHDAERRGEEAATEHADEGATLHPRINRPQDDDPAPVFGSAGRPAIGVGGPQISTRSVSCASASQMPPY